VRETPLEVPVNISVYVPGGVPFETGGLLDWPVQPLIAVTVRTKNSKGAAKASLVAQAIREPRACAGLRTSTHDRIVSRKVHKTGTGFSGLGIRKERGANMSMLFAVVVMPTFTAAGVPGVTLTVAGTVHTAPCGAPVQASETLCAAPVPVSCRE
jgi:hypothetical protein